MTTGRRTSVWEGLSEPWRACVELAWEAYCAGSNPHGAVVIDAEGNILSKGRNRTRENAGDIGTLSGNRLAHAEVNALIRLDYDRYEPNSCVMYATTEPCALCVGALRISGIGELRYASRDPWGGCAEMFETVPYIKRKNVKVVGPQDPLLETCLVTLRVDHCARNNVREQVFDVWEDTLPGAVRAGKRLHESRKLEQLQAESARASELLKVLTEEVGPR
jgi:tRNA(adenine34) deaminase